MSKKDKSEIFEEESGISNKDNMSKLRRNSRVWIIHDLLDKPLRQKDILELWRRRGRIEYEQIEKMTLNGIGEAVDTPNGQRRATIDDIKIFKPKEYKTGMGITKGTMSKIFIGDKENNHTGLIDEKIVKQEFVGRYQGYGLVQNHESLYKILTEFNNPMLSKHFITDLNNDLLNSKYAKKLININLIEKLESKLNIRLNEEEKKFILIIIKISSSALLHSLEVLNYKKSYEFIASKDIKKVFLMDLQFQAYNDITYQFGADEKMLFNPPYPVQIEFELKTSLKTKENDFKQVNTIQRSSPYFLNKEEPIKQKDEYDNAMERLKTITENVEDQIPDLFDESVDRHFNLSDSPLSYEKKLD
jgi:hypothetical protein